MDALRRGAAETGGLLSLLFPEPPVFKQVLVQILNLPAGELVQLDISNPRADSFGKAAFMPASDRALLPAGRG